MQIHSLLMERFRSPVWPVTSSPPCLAFADFIKEMGLPTTLRDIGFGEKEAAMLPEIAESCFISGGAFRPLTKEEILEIYREVL